MPHQCTNCDRTFPDGSKMMLSGCPDCGGNKFRYRPNADAARDGEESGDGPSDPQADPVPDAPPDAGGSVADAVTRATTTVREWVGRDAPDRPRRDADGKPPADPDRSPSRQVARPNGGGTVADPDEGETTARDPAGGETTARDPAGGETTARDPAGGEVTAGASAGEDAAQASARTSMVEPDELPGGAGFAAEAAEEDAGPTPTAPRSAGGPDPAASREVEPDAEADPGGPADDAGAVDATDPDAGTTRTTDDATSDISQLREELNDQFESIKIVEPGQYELNLMELYDREEYIISLMEDGRYVIEVPETWRGDRS